MIQPIVRLELYKKTSGAEDRIITYSTTPVVITEFNGVTSNFGIEKRKDKVSFNITNHRTITDGTEIFSFPNDYDVQPKDKINLYAYNSPMSGVLSDHLLLSAYVKSLDYADGETKASVGIVAYNRIEVLLNSFMFAPYNQGEQVPNMIVDSLIKIKNNNVNDIVYAYKDYSGNATPGTKGTYDNTGNTVTVTGITQGYVRAYKKAAYLSDGSGDIDPDILVSGDVPFTLDENGEYLYHFKNVSFAETYKPFIEHLEELSTEKYTFDTTSGTYITTIDSDNSLHWEPKTFNSSGIIYESQASNITVAVDNDEVVNAVIVNCGTDPNQNGILAIAYNASSMGLNGARWKYVAKTDVAEKIREEEKKSGDYTLDDGTAIDGVDNIGKTIGDDGYPDTYPWVIQTSAEDPLGSFTYQGGTTTVANNSNYKDYIRQVAKLLGKRRGEDIIKYSGDALKKIKWEFESGNNSHTAGDLIQVVLPSYNIALADVQILRIMNVAHAFSGSTWTTTLELEEDIDFKLIGGE